MDKDYIQLIIYTFIITFGIIPVMFFGDIIIYTLFLVLIFPVLFLYKKRNTWVFKKHTYILYNDYENYNSYLSYNEMMERWWIWDIEKLKSKGGE